MTLIQKIVAYMRLKNYIIFTNPGELNIVYIEGVDPDGSNNSDAWDKWNDLRIVFDHDAEGKPFIVFQQTATTEPGKSPTFTLGAMRRGGVFRIAFGQFVEAWRDGFHKNRADHPCLRQIPGAQILGYRDANKDGLRTGDLLAPGFGINQHGTREGIVAKFVGFFSEGCLVGHLWNEHLKFVETYRSDIRFIADRRFKFTTTVIPGDDMNRKFA